MKCGNLNFLEPSGPLQAFNGTALPLKTQGLWCFNVQTHVSPPEAPVDAVFYCVKVAGILEISCLKARLAAIFFVWRQRDSHILLSVVTWDHPVLTCKTPQLEVPSTISTHFENPIAWRLVSLLQKAPRFISLLLSPLFRMQGALFLRWKFMDIYLFVVYLTTSSTNQSIRRRTAGW